MDTAPFNLLGELQSFLDRRKVDVGRLDGETLVALMVDWFRLVRVAEIDGLPTEDTLVHQYGG
jgi:hypothetical protein